MAKIPVGILGATGMVGQNYISLLNNHPWFKVSYAAASPRSAGKKYEEAVAGRWHLAKTYAPYVGKITVEDANDVSRAVAAHKKKKCAFVFSALEMGKEETRALEEEYAAAGIPVISNASAHRWTEDVPVLIAEINPHHTDIIPMQQKARGWKEGFIAVKPNCSIQSYMLPLHALVQAGYLVKKIIVTTMQAVSGAGYPGVPSLDMIDNLVPYIGGEEEKSETEPLKIFGTIINGVIQNAVMPKISAHCNRVPLTDGHMACISLGFGLKKPSSTEEVKEIWSAYKGLPQEANFPMAPKQPIIYREEANRPQPRKDRDADKGMAVVIGRLRPCNIFDIRFTALSHNTVRGAAGGGILNAELLKHKGYLG
ncbi:MAG: aspartate-semialdehyde dehydrogenase [Treponema sp.]|jgi:aspartate-semialdehyde dehydrogenase|nr:aspartate-semialdehyde dehydrogenase [Treponema sp.]